MKFNIGRRRLATAAVVVGTAIGGAGIANAATSSSTPTAKRLRLPVTWAPAAVDV